MVCGWREAPDEGSREAGGGGGERSREWEDEGNRRGKLKGINFKLQNKSVRRTNVQFLEYSQ